MPSIETMTAFFGWLTVVNVGIYALTALGIATMRGWLVSLNTRLFGIADDEVRRMTFAYVGHFKLAIIIFAFAPWVALKLMA